MPTPTWESLVPLLLLAAASTSSTTAGNLISTFETGLDGYTQDNTDIFDWTRIQDGTPTADTGPTFDHTLETPFGSFLYIETSNRPVARGPGNMARLISPLYSAQNASLNFWYHMFGASIGTLNVFVRPQGEPDRPIFSLSGNQSDQWFNSGVLTIGGEPLPFNLVFEGVVGSSFTGDIAIDDIQFTSGAVVQEPQPGITSVTSTMGDSPFLTSTTATYECLARRDTGDEVIFWLGPDDRNASDSARITVEQTQPNSTTLNLTMVITEGRVEDSGRYTCVVRNNVREDNQTVKIVFQVIVALDGVTGNPFVIQFTEGSRELELMSFQHLARLVGQEPVCSVSLQLTNSGPLNDPSVERIVPTKVIDDNSGELMTSQDMIRYNKASPYSQPDLMTILRHQEYFNFANEFTLGQRTVTWTICGCGSNGILGTGVTIINLVHVNDNPPVIQLRSATVVV